jgi:hypothetical protein
MTTFSLINEEVNKQLEDSTKELQLKLKDLKKVALYEAWKILQLAVANIVRQIETSCKDLAGSDKKNVAMNFISKFYDTTFVVVDVPMIPNILEPIIHRYVKGILMILVGASIDAMVTTFREVGVFLSKQSSIKEE